MTSNGHWTLRREWRGPAPRSTDDHPSAGPHPTRAAPSPSDRHQRPHPPMHQPQRPHHRHRQRRQHPEHRLQHPHRQPHQRHQPPTRHLHYHHQRHHPDHHQHHPHRWHHQRHRHPAATSSPTAPPPWTSPGATPETADATDIENTITCATLSISTLRQDWRGAAPTPETTNTAWTGEPTDHKRPPGPRPGVAKAHAKNRQQPQMGGPTATTITSNTLTIRESPETPSTKASPAAPSPSTSPATPTPDAQPPPTTPPGASPATP